MPNQAIEQTTQQVKWPLPQLRASARVGHTLPSLHSNLMSAGILANNGYTSIFNDKEVKKAKKIQFKAGFMQGEVLDAKDAAALADLPDRDTVNAMLLGVISAPARGIATLINAVPSSVARVLQARVDEGGGAE